MHIDLYEDFKLICDIAVVETVSGTVRHNTPRL
jgi:hypothetical protein